MMRSGLIMLGLLTACATPHRPPTVAPARIEMERLTQRHFLKGEASKAEQTTLARLLDLHGRGAEAALLEAGDDPARAERAWFAGPRSAPFATADVARTALPIATAHYPDDPRAIRTLWLLAHSANLNPHFLAGLANRWRADWPASDEARIAFDMSKARVTPTAETIDLSAWARSHPLDTDAIRSADARWRPPADLATGPRWAAVRVLAVWRAGAFDVLTTRVSRLGPVTTSRHRSDHVPTAVDRVVHHLQVRVWGSAVVPFEGAPTPSSAPGGWTATAQGIPARRLDDWASSAGPRWAPPDVLRAPQQAALHWRLSPNRNGWRGTLSARGLKPDFDRLLALYPGLTITALRRLPQNGWRASVAFQSTPTRSLLDDAQVEVLGGPIAMRTLALAPRRQTDLTLPPAQVDIRLTTPEPWAIASQTARLDAWQQTIEGVGPRTVRRAWQRPAIDWPAGLFEKRRAPAQSLHAQAADLGTGALPETLRKLIGAAAPSTED